MMLGSARKVISVASTEESYTISSRLEAIATRVEAIATRVEAIATRVEAIALRLEAIATRVEAIALRLEAITASNKKLLVARSIKPLRTSGASFTSFRPVPLPAHRCQARRSKPREAHVSNSFKFDMRGMSAYRRKQRLDSPQWWPKVCYNQRTCRVGN